MITIQLNEHSAEDFKMLRELQALGLSDEVLQKAYDETQKRRQDNDKSTTAGV